MAHSVEVKGLEDQLLGRVILTEKQELESDRVQLMTEVTANKRKMKELQDDRSLPPNLNQRVRLLMMRSTLHV